MTGPNRTPPAWLKGDDWKFGTPYDPRAPLPSDLPPLDPDPRELPADYGTVSHDPTPRIDWEYVAALVVAGALIVGLIVLWPTQVTTPKRIQRKRTKGWRMPEGAVYVGRTVAGVSGSPYANYHYVAPDMPPALAVALYRREVEAVVRRYPDWAERLRGRDLVCWCPLDQPCHADVLLELANVAVPA